MGARKEIGGYKILEQIGYGGMSTVYAAEDGDGNRVALKLMHPAFADSAGRERLTREVAMLNRVRGSRVAQVLDAETEAEDAFIVTELIDGPTLEKDVAENGVYEGDDLVELAEQLNGAIHSIHRVGVLHRDLKPSNVMIGENGPVLIDFGISQLGDDVRLTQAGALAQTPGYCDPRVVRGAQPDEEADWWALAAVLLFAATGRPPFGKGTADRILTRVLDGNADVEGLDESISQAFLAALAPKDRIDYDTLMEILRDPDCAEELLASPSDDDATQVLTYEKTRVYEALPTQIQKQQDQALDPTAILDEIPADPTEVVDTYSYAEEHFASEESDYEEMPSFYYDSGREVQPTTPHGMSPVHTGANVAQHNPAQLASPYNNVANPVWNPNAAQPYSPVHAANQVAPYGSFQQWNYGANALETMPRWAHTAPKSSWLVLLIGLTLSVYASYWTNASYFVYAFLIILASTIGILAGELRERRMMRGGVDSKDKVGVAVRIPWALVRAILFSIVSLIFGALAYGIVIVISSSLRGKISLVGLSGGSAPLADSVFLGVSFFAFLFISWIFPTNKRGREGARSFLYSFTPSWGYKLFWSFVLIVAIIVGIVVVDSLPAPEWILQ